MWKMDIVPYGEDPRFLKAFVDERIEKAADEYLKFAASLDPKFAALGYGGDEVKKALESGDSNMVLVPETISRDIYDYLYKRSYIRQLFEFVRMPTNTYKWAVQSGITEVRYRPAASQGLGVTESKPAFGTPIQLDAKELVADTAYTDIASEDAAFNVASTVVRTLGNSFKEYEEKAFILGDTADGTCTGDDMPAICAFDGLEKMAPAGQTNDLTEAELTDTLVGGVIPIFQDQGVGASMALFGNAFVINKWVTSNDFKTWDKLGPKATLITGQLASMYDIRVFQTRHLARYDGGTKNVADTLIVDPTVAAVGGYMRGYRMERDRNIHKMVWELVASERIAWSKARDIGIYLFQKCLAE